MGKIDSYSDYVKSVKRINQRIVETNRVMGQKSHAYNEFASRLEEGFKQEELNIHRNGFYQISRSKSTYERLKSMGELDTMESLESVQTMRERRKMVKQYVPKEKLTVEEQNNILRSMDTFLGSMDECLGYLYNAKDSGNLNEKSMSEVVDAIELMKQKGKKSYSDLFRVQQVASEYVSKGDVFSGL